MENLKRIWNSIFVPTSIKPIRFILMFQNILCVYRNFDYYKKKRRVMISFRIAIELLLTIGSIITYSIYILPISTTGTSESIFLYMNAISSILVIILSCYSSKIFKKLLLLIESNNLYFADDAKYQRNMRRQDSIIKCGLIVCNIIIISAEFEELFHADQENAIEMFTNISNLLFTINAKFSNCRSVNEYIALYSLLYIMAEQVECITRAVSKESTHISVSTIPEQRDTMRIDDDDFNGTVEIKEFEELSAVFSNIKECSTMFNKVYGLQLVLMLGTATIYCIMFMYTMAFLSVKGFPDIRCLVGSVLKLVMFFMLLLLLSIGGQKKKNNVQNLRRQLGKILINCVDNDPQYKATKDFLRLVSTRAIKTETLGGIGVDMSLMPSFIMFITSYTVIALQFNNIV